MNKSYVSLAARILGSSCIDLKWHCCSWNDTRGNEDSAPAKHEPSWSMPWSQTCAIGVIGVFGVFELLVIGVFGVFELLVIELLVVGMLQCCQAACGDCGCWKAIGFGSAGLHSSELASFVPSFAVRRTCGHWSLWSSKNMWSLLNGPSRWRCPQLSTAGVGMS